MNYEERSTIQEKKDLNPPACIELEVQCEGSLLKGIAKAKGSESFGAKWPIRAGVSNTWLSGFERTSLVNIIILNIMMGVIFLPYVSLFEASQNFNADKVLLGRHFMNTWLLIEFLSQFKWQNCKKIFQKFESYNISLSIRHEIQRFSFWHLSSKSMFSEDIQGKLYYIWNIQSYNSITFINK